MKRTALLPFLLGAVVAAPAESVRGQEPSVRVYVTPGTTMGLGSQFILNVEITGTRSVDRNPEVPELASFAHFLGSNSQSSVRTSGGRTTVSLTIQYRYQALTVGEFRIPPFEVLAGGLTHTTEAVAISITEAAPESSRQQSTGIGPDDLFITAEASQTSVREGEPLVVEYRIWTRVDVTNFGLTTVPEPEGFWAQDITPSGQPEVEQLTRNGVAYASAVIRRIALVPSGVGEHTLEPIGVEAQVRVQGRRDPFEDIFGRSSLFGGSTTVPTTVISNALSIDVEPLPPGRPDSYSGVVGNLRLTAELDRDSVDANDAVTLTLRVSGEGNIRAIPSPEPAFPSDFEVFPPEVTESVSPTTSGLAGSKTFEYVIIPRAPGRREIPSVELAYLDEATGAYRTIESGVLPLTVSGTVVDGPGSLARGGVAQLREDIRFIRLGSLELRRTGRPLFSGTGFWMFALLPLVGVLGAVALRRHWDLLEGDVAYARGRRAGRVAKKRLAEANRLASGDDPRAFYAEVARALRGFVADRLNVAEAGLQTSELEGLLTRRGVESETREDLLSCLEHCDRQRFAPPESDPEEKSRFLDRAAALMTSLDRAVR